MGDFDSIAWLLEHGTSDHLRVAKQQIDCALRAKVDAETNAERNFEYGVALKDKGFGYITLSVPALGIQKGIQIRDGQSIEEIAVEIIKQEFENDEFCLYGEDYVPPHSDWATDFPEYADHTWIFVTVLTPVSPEI